MKAKALKVGMQLDRSEEKIGFTCMYALTKTISNPSDTVQSNTINT